MNSSRRSVLRLSQGALLAGVLLPLTAQVPADREAAMRNALAAEITRGKAVIEDDWISQLAAKLISAAKISTPLTVQVLDHPQPSWYALPDRVYVHTGTILRARSEEQFREQLAHQLAHAHLRHGWEASSSPQGGRIPLIFPNLCLDHGASVLIPHAMQERVRQAEAEARQVASGWLADQPSDPEGYAQMKARLAERAQTHKPFRKPTLYRTR